MDEDVWLPCDDPGELVDYHVMKRDKRRLRLLAVACVRRAFALILPPDPAYEVIFQAVESYADGGKRSDFLAARKSARRLTGTAAGTLSASLAALERLTGDQMEALTVAISRARDTVPTADTVGECHLIRDLFNPFAPKTFDPAWRTEAVLRLARAAYDERTLPGGRLKQDRLLILADALEDVGADAVILRHLRGEEPHARGCWAIDLILLRE